jgi:hypothetical protein
MRIEKDTIAAGIVFARPAKMGIWRNGMRASCVREALKAPPDVRGRFKVHVTKISNLKRINQFTELCIHYCEKYLVRRHLELTRTVDHFA